jgi:hypothetical protein
VYRKKTELTVQLLGANSPKAMQMKPSYSADVISTETYQWVAMEAGLWTSSQGDSFEVGKTSTSVLYPASQTINFGSLHDLPPVVVARICHTTDTLYRAVRITDITTTNFKVALHGSAGTVSVCWVAAQEHCGHMTHPYVFGSGSLTTSQVNANFDCGSSHFVQTPQLVGALRSGDLTKKATQATLALKLNSISTSKFDMTYLEEACTLIDDGAPQFMGYFSIHIVPVQALSDGDKTNVPIAASGFTYFSYLYTRATPNRFVFGLQITSGPTASAKIKLFARKDNYPGISFEASGSIEAHELAIKRVLEAADELSGLEKVKEVARAASLRRASFLGHSRML